MKMHTCLALALLGVSASASKENWATTTIVHRVTTHLPYEQHRCYSLFLLKSENSHVPQEACLLGACCVEIVKANDCIQEIIPTGDPHEKFPTGRQIVTNTDIPKTMKSKTPSMESHKPVTSNTSTTEPATSGSEKPRTKTLRSQTPESSKVTPSKVATSSNSASSIRKPIDFAGFSSPKPSFSTIMSSTPLSSSKPPSATRQSSKQSSTKPSSSSEVSNSPQKPWSSSHALSKHASSSQPSDSSAPTWSQKPSFSSHLSSAPVSSPTPTSSKQSSSAKPPSSSVSPTNSVKSSSSRQDRSSDPMIEVPLASTNLASSSLSMSISKPSSSSTSTKSIITYTKACPTPTCQSGIENALFSNPFRDDTSRNYTTFNPSHFKTQKPIDTRIVSEIYVRDDGKNKTLSNAALEYRAFLFACQDGTYRFNSPRSDDITIMWFGDEAYNGWTRDNADIIQFYYGDNKPQDVTRNITAGTYYPIRVMWGNTGGAADLSLRIYAPDGRELFGHGQDSASYLTTEACDGSYEKFAPFGKEP